MEVPVQSERSARQLHQGPAPLRVVDKGRRDPQCARVWRVLVLVRVRRVQRVLACPWEFFDVLWREQFLEGSLGALSSMLELSSLESPLAFYKVRPWICYPPSKLSRTTGPTRAVVGQAARTRSGTLTEL